MGNFLIVYENEETLKSLKQFGEIIYKSRVINLVGIRTQHNSKELMNVRGVTSVTRESFGKLI